MLSGETFEQAAQSACEQIYNEFKINDVSQFSLVRVFRLCTKDDLPPEKGATNEDYSLALMGTYGEEPNWCNRLNSQGHGVIGAGAFKTPMLKATFEQINIKVGALQEGEKLKPDIIMDGGQLTKFFHVQHALGSDYIVAQDEFVVPYKIKSVIGVGAVFLSGAFYIFLGFSKTEIDEKMAQNFVKIAPFLSTLMLLYDSRGNLWNVD